MRLKLILLLIIIALFVNANAQDKIITLKNDTIDCSILEINPKQLIFEIDSKGIKSKGEINRSEISGYFLSANSRATFENANTKSENKQQRKPSKFFSAFQFGLSGGYGSLLGSSKAAQNILISKGFGPAEVREYYDDFRGGLLIDACAHYLFFNVEGGSVGCGLNYSLMTSSQSVSGYILEDIEQDGVLDWYFATYSEKYYINFYGLSIYAKKKVGPIKLYLEDALGFVSYRNELKYLSGPLLLTSASLGTKSKLGIEIPVTKNLLVDINSSLFFSQLSWIKRNNGYNSQKMQLDSEYKENLSRFEVALGLKYFIPKKANQ